MREFGQSLLNADLVDLNYKGNTFTWWNKQKAAPVAKKLDRVLVNDQWYEEFPNSIACFLDPDFSDHASSTITLQPALKKKKRPFQFLFLLLQKNGIL